MPSAKSIRDVQLSFEINRDPRRNQKAAGSRFLDPTFAYNRKRPIHRWVPWVAGYSADFVTDVLLKYLPKPGRLVLDPFAGVGTTLVETLLNGHRALGFEINPYAAFASRVKLSALDVDCEMLLNAVAAFQLEFDRRIRAGYQVRSRPPSGFQTRAEFYSPQILHKVLVALDIIAELKQPQIKDIFALAFGSTMVTFSNYSYEPSLGRRVSAGKSEFEDYDVAGVILQKLNDIYVDVSSLDRPQPESRYQYQLIPQSCFTYEQHICPEEVDIVITSPPYLNNYHYNRNTRPQVYWLDLVSRSQDLREIEESSFGKYWQTVRGGEDLELRSDIRSVSLRDTIETIRRKNPEKGVYGGSGWANYAITYFNDCFRFAEMLNKVLKPGSSAIIVIGNSIIQGTMIPTDRYFAEVAQVVGLEIVGIDTPRSKRVGNSIVQSGVRVLETGKRSSYTN